MVGALNDGMGEQRQYQHVDRGWNIRAISDQAGNVLERYLYSPFGRRTVLTANGGAVHGPASAHGQAYGYTGQRYDETTGLHYFKNRYLEPELGRFISRDPAGYVDGMSLYMAYFVLTGVDVLGLCSGAPPPNVMPLISAPELGLTTQDAFVQGQKQAFTAMTDLDNVQTGLDSLGFAGPVGPFADGANAVISAARGNFLEAGLNAAAMVPFVGDGLKAGAMAAKHADNVVDGMRDTQAVYRGGRHAEMQQPVGDGLQSHHMPDRNADPNVSAGDGPAIQMEFADHRATSSWGRSGQEYRAETADMIQSGRYRDAMAREIRDVRNAAGQVSSDRTKYNSAIRQMLGYARSSGQLPPRPAPGGLQYLTVE